MKPQADAIILNPMANAGNGAGRWKAVLQTELAREVGLGQAAIFDGAQGLAGLDGWVSDRIRSGARNFVAAGGDGTLNLALNALLRAPERRGLAPGGLRFGAVGLGSSNDFQKPYATPGRARVVGMPCRLQFADAKAQDVGRVETAESERYFVINASVGVTAEANWNFNEARGGALGFLKRHWVDGAIIATALKTFWGYRNFEVSISTATAANPSARLVTLTNLGVVKNVHFSGQMRYDIPQAGDDGRFGVHLCEGMGRLEMVGVLAALSVGKFSGRPKTSSLSASELEIASVSGAPFAIETDGEVVRSRRAKFMILPREIFLCP